MPVVSMSPKLWYDQFMQDAYLNAFGSERSPELERVDFVMIGMDKNKNALGFISCKEMDSETVYWQFGGAFRNAKNTLSVYPTYLEFIKFCKDRYKRITTRIENTNLSMLKLALKCGFLIQGVWYFQNKIYLELCLEFGRE